MPADRFDPARERDVDVVRPERAGIDRRLGAESHEADGEMRKARAAQERVPQPRTGMQRFDPRGIEHPVQAVAEDIEIARPADAESSERGRPGTAQVSELWMGTEQPRPSRRVSPRARRSCGLAECAMSFRLAIGHWL
jgi:hypothetical protein